MMTTKPSPCSFSHLTESLQHHIPKMKTKTDPRLLCPQSSQAKIHLILWCKQVTIAMKQYSKGTNNLFDFSCWQSSFCDNFSAIPSPMPVSPWLLWWIMEAEKNNSWAQLPCNRSSIEGVRSCHAASQRDQRTLANYRAGSWATLFSAEQTA